MKTSLKAKLLNLKARQTNINKYSASHLVYNMINNAEEKLYIIYLKMFLIL